MRDSHPSPELYQNCIPVLLSNELHNLLIKGKQLFYLFTRLIHWHITVHYTQYYSIGGFFIRN